MKRIGRSALLLLFSVALAAAFQFVTTSAQAQSSYFSARGCTGCHDTAAATCVGCHRHSGTLSATANKTSFAPGEMVTVTLTASGARAGWLGARLYGQGGAEIARSKGNESNMGGSTVYPAVLSAPAPAQVGNYTWRMAYLGNQDGTGSGDVHSEKSVNVTFAVAATAPAADTTPPVVKTFTLPATATSLTVPVTLSATDNVAASGYLITVTSTPPAASDSGWTAAPPANVTAVPGQNTFVAWAKDAAGNVSAGKNATVMVTLPDATPPVVQTFTLPATATGLSIPVTALSATDNIGVTGYLITTSSTAPAPSASEWTAAPPSVVTAPGQGAVTFYAWARDAVGNVSTPKNATMTVTIPAPTADTIKPTLTVSTLPNGSFTNKVTLNVSGTASDAGGLKSITVNGQPVEVTAANTFSSAVVLTVGKNPVTVVATDKAGNQTTDNRTVTYDPTAPVLTIATPADNSTSAKSVVSASGTVNENSTVSVKVNNGASQSAAMTGNNFAATVNLAPGINTIDISAADPSGNVTSAKRTVTYSAAGSQINLAVTKPAQDVTTRRRAIMIWGTVINSSAIKVTVQEDGRSYSPKVGAKGRFSQMIKLRTKGKTVITVKATDAYGNSATVVRNVIYRPEGGEREHDD